MCLVGVSVCGVVFVNVWCVCGVWFVCVPVLVVSGGCGVCVCYGVYAWVVCGVCVCVVCVVWCV